MSRQITALWWVFHFAFMFMPFVAVIISGIPFLEPIDIRYIGAFVTASGVFLGILTAALINKPKILEPSLTLAIQLDLVYFAGTLFLVFQSALSGEPKVSDLTVIMSSLMIDISTAISVIDRLRRN